MKNGHLITRLLELGAGIYDSVLKLTLDERRFRERLIQMAELTGDEQVLDIGCGTGTLDLILAKFLNDGYVWGIDISRKMIKQARRKVQRSGCKIKYQLGSSESLPYKSNVFDVVFTSLIYHHLTYEEKEETLREIHRVLKPTGRYVSAEFGRFPDDPLHRIFIRFTPSDSKHLMALTHNSGVLHGLYPPDLIETAGFYVVRQIDGPLLGGHHQVIYRFSQKEAVRNQFL
ncbi:MAG: class I SAM-dependent methyltransferase [Candidatus Latescibacteria bacterium]|nr:class I SAM-dependent methyltransferase [Candidatus Latescibacterota bacterium]